MHFHSASLQDVLRELKAGEKGLSSGEAERRLKTYGTNELHSAEPVRPFRIFLRQFASPLVWVLIGALAIAIIAREHADAGVIALVILLNSILGFVQEFRAEKAIEALKKMIAPKATVLRNGRPQEVDATTVVPGDVILLDTGGKVAADCRLLSATNLFSEEAGLTGESVPGSKQPGTLSEHTILADQTNMLFAGTSITNGHGTAIITTTGMHTEMGKIARLLHETSTPVTPLHQELAKVGKVTALVVIGIAALVLLIGISVKHQPFFEVLLIAVALAVAAIPEGLPAVVTLTLALGVQQLATRHALVRNLASVQTLGSCTVICSDKTGTLTHNEMTVRKIYANRTVTTVSGSGYAPEGLFSTDTKNIQRTLLAGVLNNNATVQKNGASYEVIGDPTEAALLVAAQKAGIKCKLYQSNNPRIGEIEFTAERKCMSTIHRRGDIRVVYTKGAPDILLKQCTHIQLNEQVVHLSSADRDAILKANDDFASQALRVLGFAYRDLDAKEKTDGCEHDLIFLGLQAMIDPPRKEAKDAIQRCHTAGIRVVMITGDHLTTAQAVARELGIVGKAVTGIDFEHMHHDRFIHLVDEIAIYARVNPSHKLRIIEALRHKHHVVAMTGDGVNDAPALKAADLGIAMGITGTDVAKEASVMVLADDNFATIVGAIEEGRRIYDNIQKTMAYLFSCNIAEVLIVFLAALLQFPVMPLTAIQILWINLVTDGPPALALGIDPAAPNIMQRKPRRRNKSIFSGLGMYLLVYPILVTAGVLGAFAAYLPFGAVKAQTVAFSTLVFFEIFQTYSCRSLISPSVGTGLFKNTWIVIGTVSSALLQVAIVNMPFFHGIFGITSLNLQDWLVVIGMSFAGFVFLEVAKAVRGKTAWY